LYSRILKANYETDAGVMQRSGGDQGRITQCVRDLDHDQSQKLAQLQKAQPDISLFKPHNEKEGGERESTQ